MCVKNDQYVNIDSFMVRCDQGGLALNDTGFILVQATCPMSSLGRSVTLFLSTGARSLQWGYKRVGKKEGVKGPVGLWTEGSRVTGAPMCAKYWNVCSV